jgi:hypothetical protein
MDGKSASNSAVVSARWRFSASTSACNAQLGSGLVFHNLFT